MFKDKYSYVSDTTITSFPTNIKKGDLNPLHVPSVKQLININTRFRDNYNNTQSSDFIFKLPERIKKVVSMKTI